jgi:methylglutaconyl-CoA hydratase
VSDEFERILYERDDLLARITLNRPEKRNALDDLTVAELRVALHIADDDPEVHVIVLAGAGKDFCAGADLSQLELIASGAGPLENLDDAAELGALFVQLRRLGKPVVALVHGHAFAGGAGLATACDIVIASDDALFGYPEVNLGFVPAMVMALLRRSCGEKVAFQLVAGASRISAAEAQRIGLVNQVFAHETFQRDALEIAHDLAKRSPSALRLTKRLLYGMDGLSFEEAIARGVEVNVLARMTEDCQAGVRSFLASRERKSPDV